MRKCHLNEAAFDFCELAGTRTQGPYIKSVLLYQLSYQFAKVFPFRGFQVLNNQRHET